MKNTVKRKRRAVRLGVTTCYHVFSHFCAEVGYLADWEKDVFRRQLWKTAYSCGVEVLTYTILGNHFHLLLRIPGKLELTDAELLKRYRALYPKPNKFQAKSVEDYERALSAGGSGAERAREELLKRMGDLSKFMQLFKQRFTIWYNKTHMRAGTLWSGRYKSVLVEDSVEVLKVVAAYIDLNAVRAGIVKDPKDYRFSGYGEWLGGNVEAAEGFAGLFKHRDTGWCLAQYRLILFGKGAVGKSDGSGAVLDLESVRDVLAAGGELSLSERLLCRARYFRDGCVLGTGDFVREQIPFILESGVSRRKGRGAFKVPGFGEVELMGFRQLRGRDV